MKNPKEVNNRFIWAISVLKLRPAENILEIGCGTGILTGQIALQLNSGTITAIDRSKPMMKLAEQRNEEYMQAGKVKLVTADFARTKLAEHYFDKIVAFNVNIFWKGSEQDFQQIRRCLKPSGKLFVFYETPAWADTKIETNIKMILGQHGFKIVDTISLKQPPCICIIAN
jgi:ubiquinone/menaquinone biosynthesis C-methylase UbiE